METLKENLFPLVSSKVQISPAFKLLSSTNSFQPRQNSATGDPFLSLTLNWTGQDLPSENQSLASHSFLLMYLSENLFGMHWPN